jgi:hypothetical protein
LDPRPLPYQGETATTTTTTTTEVVETLEVLGPNPRLPSPPSPPINWTDFRAYLLKSCRPNTVKIRMCYARRFYSLLSNQGADTSALLQLAPETRLHATKSLTALSKYLGCYEQLNKTRRQYNLKWTTGNESLQAMERFFNPEMSLDHMLHKVREMMRVLPPDISDVIRFASITGLRPGEACESVGLLNCHPVDKSVTGDRYYNHEQQCLEHFRFPSIFLRQTKKAYISYLSRDNYRYFANLGPNTPGWNAIRLTCRHKKIHMDMRFCRKIFASHLIKSGIDSNTVDMLSGRCPSSVLVRHYQVPDSSLSQKVLNAVSELQKQITTTN